ncbi:hypothetical protein QBC35DRAFT_456862 [Podospora australis]|uniref:DUF7918 domain-containing protein n=1 Tax=Podospora australis TaxID=1536484 RepID=A0AAN7ABU3_9PEZI|nr:hypothetical protein QBC35DRAFT_456862 [Podospora australis]
MVGVDVGTGRLRVSATVCLASYNFQAGETAKEYDDPDGAEGRNHGMNVDDFDLTPQQLQGGSIPYIVKYIEAKPGTKFAYNVDVLPSFFNDLQADHIGYSVSNDGNISLPLHIPRESVRGKLRNRWFGSEYNGFLRYDPNQARFHRAGSPLGLPGVVPLNRVLEKSTTPESSAGRRPPEVGVPGAASGEVWQETRFQFPAFDIVEPDAVSTEDLKGQMKAAKNYGVLKVFLFKLDKAQVIPLDTSVPAYTAAKTLTIAEKALKGKAVDFITRQLFGPKAPTLWHVEFRYRSKQGLIKEGIVPRQTVSDEINGMSEAEVRQRLASLLEGQRRSEQGQEDQKDMVRVKQEGPKMSDAESTSRYHARKLANSRLEVDLTAPAVKREASHMDEAGFSAKYKTWKLEGGRVEVDLTDD